MSVKKCENVETSKYEIEFDADAAAFEEAVEKAYMLERGRMSVPGFRKGKAPRKFVEKVYGDNVFHERAVNILLNTELPKVIDELKLNVIYHPDVEVLSLDKNEGVVFKAVCFTLPDVEVGEYKGITVEKVDNTLTDEQLEERIKGQLEGLRRREARLVSIDSRPAQMGDEVVIDFEGSMDGILFEGGAAENFNLKLGSGQFIPGFEEQVAGHSVDEKFDITVTFPENYQKTDLAGKEAVFKINLHEINEEELPELDDELVQDATEYSTVEEFKAAAKEAIINEAENRAESETTNNIFKKLIESSVCEVPSIMIEKEIDEEIREFEYRLESQGMKLEMYLEYTGMDIDAFRKTYEERSIEKVKLRLILGKITKLENIEVTDEEVEKGLELIALQNNMKVYSLKKNIAVDNYRANVLLNKAMDFVKQNAVIQ